MAVGGPRSQAPFLGVEPEHDGRNGSAITIEVGIHRDLILDGQVDGRRGRDAAICKRVCRSSLSMMSGGGSNVDPDYWLRAAALA